MGSIQGFIKISLLALGLLSMATWVPQMYTFLKTLFMVYLPSLASAIVAPKCLFVFSNIIVVILVGESKLGHPKAKENIAAVLEGDIVQEKEGEEDVVVEAALAMPAITGDDDQVNNQLQDEEFIVQDEVVDALWVTEDVEIDQPDQEGHDLAVGEVIITDIVRNEEEVVHEDEEVLAEDQRDDLPPAEELNRRVEEFIARFNMERQLEARMLVCCC
uniref:DUF4408 domain-containing protein n=1 Tax=Leersia perrieri TaxID=77586 RepID=A0A0D9XZ44_9ORYZ